MAKALSAGDQLLFLEDDPGISNAQSFALRVNQHRIGIRFCNFIHQVIDHARVFDNGLDDGFTIARGLAANT